MRTSSTTASTKSSDSSAAESGERTFIQLPPTRRRHALSQNRKSNPSEQVVASPSPTLAQIFQSLQLASPQLSCSGPSMCPSPTVCPSQPVIMDKDFRGLFGAKKNTTVSGEEDDNPLDTGADGLRSQSTHTKRRSSSTENTPDPQNQTR